jgi:hypothetical protein
MPPQLPPLPPSLSQHMAEEAATNVEEEEGDTSEDEETDD